MNTIHVRGRLSDAVKVTQTSTGTYLIKGTIADNYSWNNTPDGESKVNWINFTRFTKNEPSEKYVARLIKGAYVVIDGRLETSKREVDGTVYNNLEVIASALEAPMAARLAPASGEETPVSTDTPSPAVADPDLPF